MLSEHEYHPLAVADIVDETTDTRSFTLEIPASLEATFRYAAGQFCTFRATIYGEAVVRCYSMSSSPDTGDPLRAAPLDTRMTTEPGVNGFASAALQKRKEVLTSFSQLAENCSQLISWIGAV